MQLVIVGAIGAERTRLVIGRIFSLGIHLYHELLEGEEHPEEHLPGVFILGTLRACVACVVRSFVARSVGEKIEKDEKKTKREGEATREKKHERRKRARNGGVGVVIERWRNDDAPQPSPSRRDGTSKCPATHDDARERMDGWNTSAIKIKKPMKGKIKAEGTECPPAC